MTIDQLFIALPRDLQWEILETFIGTHVVRNGKLMRKMTGQIQAKLLAKMPTLVGMRNIKLIIKNKPIQQKGNICDPHTKLCIRSFTNLRGPRFRLLCMGENLDTGELFYRYITEPVGEKKRITIVTPLDNSIVLPPFIKNNYPSYPFTDKKKGIRYKRM